MTVVDIILHTLDITNPQYSWRFSSSSLAAPSLGYIPQTYEFLWWLYCYYPFVIAVLVLFAISIWLSCKKEKLAVKAELTNQIESTTETI